MLILRKLNKVTLKQYQTMKANMGGADRIIRILIAVVAAVLYFSGTISETVGIVAMVVAGIFLLTSLISFCPLYTILGINTCPTKK